MSHLQGPQDLERRARNAEESIATARTQKRALDAAITAAELYLNAYRLASSAQDKKRLDAKCNALLTRAEIIKKSANWAFPSPAPSVQTSSSSNTSSQFHSNRAPSSRALSKREQIILLEGSKLHGSIFPPWQGLPDAKDFERKADGSLYEDEQDELRLSDEQKEFFAGWKRPDEALVRHGAGKDAKVTMVAENPLDLVQDAATDCSVVASMCAVVAHTVKRSGCSQLFFKNFFPQDEITHLPMLSRSGKYILRFFLNGCYRKITIDDRLPTSRAASSSTLHVIDRNNLSLLWPSLIEKAYLKVRGGYDFPGSNSGTDLWILTGWIPEQIFLHDEESEMSLAEIWTRVFEVWEKGDVLVTIGTGELTEEVEM
ncbi:cysteine protease [Ascosphaera aggregata]|nr:cysteine protease [Ascosphaera aggregata]